MERTFHMLLYRAFHAQRTYLWPSLNELGLGSGQPKLVAYLAARGPCRQREMADYFDVDPATVSRMLDSLQKGGFVTRRADEQNRRCDLVEVTQLGRQASVIWRERCRQAEGVMLQGFTEEERERFSDYLSRAYQNLHRAEKEEEKA